jgi:hypothetical protein
MTFGAFVTDKMDLKELVRSSAQQQQQQQQQSLLESE